VTERRGDTGIDSPTDLPKHAWRAAFRRTVREFVDDDLFDWAAALTYYSVLSIFPAIVGLLAALWAACRHEVLRNVDGVVLPESRRRAPAMNSRLVPHSLQLCRHRPNSAPAGYSQAILRQNGSGSHSHWCRVKIVEHISHRGGQALVVLDGNPTPAGSRPGTGVPT
jgi:hypothetical protein